MVQIAEEDEAMQIALSGKSVNNASNHESDLCCRVRFLQSVVCVMWRLANCGADHLQLSADCSLNPARMLEIAQRMFKSARIEYMM